MSAMPFDDANSDIPGGLMGAVDRVVVVGAGISGLTIAAALKQAEVECVVLEARDRIGGRLHTVDLGGMPVDLGGSWIHHPIGNPLTAFSERQGLQRLAGNPLPTIGGYDVAEARRLSKTEIDDLVDIQFEQFPAALDSLRRQLPEDANAAQAIEAFLRMRPPGGLPNRVIRQALRAEVEADASAGAEQQSLRWIWNELEYEGDLFGDLPTDGYRSLVQSLAAGIDIRTSAVVESVVVTEAGVGVTLQGGEVEEASHVVITVPLGVLKSGGLDFRPPLPPDRREAIAQLGFGSYEKVVLVFDRSFWRDSAMSHSIVFPRAEDLAAMWFFDLDAFDAGPAIAAHLFHTVATSVRDWPPGSVVDWVRALISEASGLECLEPIATAVTSWSEDPYSMGSYTHVPPNAEPAYLDVIGQPVHGRILFAGEHTQSARMGYADGAFTSGIREAKRLLRAPSVLLRGG